MGSCHSGDHIAEYHIHTDITISTTEEPQQKSALERSVIDYWGINMFNGSKPLPFASAVVETFGPHEGFLTHQRNNTGNKRITDKTYGESETTRQKQRIVTPGDFNTNEIPEQKKTTS